MAQDRFPRWLTVTIPVLLILAWLTSAAIAGPYFGRIEEVSSNDPAAYLPTEAEATKVQNKLTEFVDSDAIPAIIVMVSPTSITDAQLAELTAGARTLESIASVSGQPSPALRSEDARAVQILVPISKDADIAETVHELRTAATSFAPESFTTEVTGPAGFTADLSDAFAGIDGLLLAVALGAVLIVLVVVYRSPLLAVIVLFTSISALSAAILTVWWLAYYKVVVLSGQTQGILFILVIGAATDYSLLYVARYREALRTHPRRWDATQAALRGTAEPILASGGTVIAGLLCLLLSQLASNRSLGPVAAIGIGFAMLAANTLLPALLFVAGKVAYWPRRITQVTDTTATHDSPRTGIWGKIPGFVRAHARVLWIASVLVLAIASLGVTQLKADGVPSSELVLGVSPARDGQRLLEEHFSSEAGSPVYVLTQEDDLQRTADIMASNAGVDSVSVASADVPSGAAPVTSDGIQSPIPHVTVNPTVVDGHVLLEGALTSPPDSAEAELTVTQLRESVPESALVGGATAVTVDTNAAATADLYVIVPAVLLVICAILILLLRALVAPVILIGTVVLSFAATMGVSALVFNHLLGFPGADPSVPLFGFVFLVALGIDYNIFLMTRVREESLTHGAREGMSRGLAITGGVITSAGLVLAATFAALAVLPILFLVQLAFIVAFGVLLDTFLVRTLLVPALGYELGRTLWKPSKAISS